MILPAVAVGLARNDPPQPELRLASLQAVLSPLASEAGYGLNLPERLAGRPVVYFFSTKAGPLARVQGLARALGLEITLSRDGRTLDVARNAKGKGVSIEERAEAAVEAYRRAVAPLLERTLQERYDEKIRILRLSQAAFDVRDFEEGYRINGRLDLLNDLETPMGEALARTVLAGDARTYPRRASRARREDVPPEARAVLAEYLAGRGITIYDYPNPTDALRGRPSDERWAKGGEEGRARGLALGRGAPVLYLDHRLAGYGRELFLGLRGFTPFALHLVASVTLPLAPAGAGKPGVESGTEANREFEARDPLRFERFPTVSALGSAAPAMGLDYADWYREDRLAYAPLGRTTLAAIFRSQRAPQARVRRDGTWLLVESLDNAWPEYHVDWRPFDAVEPIVEGAPPSPERLLAVLEPLKERELDSLEDLLPEGPEWDARYTGVTSGVRLLRAALREGGGKALDKPIGELSPAARADARRFFDGAYVWEYFPWLTHPANAGFLNKIRLKVSNVGKGDRRTLRVTIAFPKGIPMPPGLDQAVFATPIS